MPTSSNLQSFGTICCIPYEQRKNKNIMQQAHIEKRHYRYRATLRRISDGVIVIANIWLLPPPPPSIGHSILLAQLFYYYLLSISIFLLISVRLTRFPRVAFIFHWACWCYTRKKMRKKKSRYMCVYNV